MWWILALGLAAACGTTGFVLFRVRQRSRSSRTYGAYQFVKVKYLALDESVRAPFMTHTPPLVKLGFELIGDYRLKPVPMAVHGRVFLSRDGETLARIDAVAGAISFISVLEDGTCVHTTSAKDASGAPTPEPSDQLWISYMPGGSIAELYRNHVNVVKGLCASAGSKEIRFRKDQFRAVMVYDQRAIGRWRFRQGGLDHKPPRPNLAVLLDKPLITEGSERTLVGS